MIRDNNKLINFLEWFYEKELKETKNYMKEEYKRDNVSWTILNKESTSISHLLKFTNEDRIFNTEFFYERKSKVVISGMRWHEDFARSLYIDIYGEKMGEFNNVAHNALVKEKLYGFMSTVGERKMKYHFKPSSLEKLYFGNYI